MTQSAFVRHGSFAQTQQARLVWVTKCTVGRPVPSSPEHPQHSIGNHCGHDSHHHHNNDNSTEEQVLRVVETPTKSSNILAESSDMQGTPALLVTQVAG